MRIVKSGPPVVFFGRPAMDAAKSKPMSLNEAERFKNLFNEFGLGLVVFIVFPGVG